MKDGNFDCYENFTVTGSGRATRLKVVCFSAVDDAGDWRYTVITAHPTR